jgi:hypothetical protein
MSDETKDKVRVFKNENDPSGNVATVTTHEMQGSDFKVKRANKLVREAGTEICPFNQKYLGSAVVHYYNNGDAIAPVLNVVCQVTLDAVDEGHADFGWKRLQEALMKSFGRSVPEFVK